MRHCLSILPAIVILLTLGMELRASPGVAGVKDPSHWVCVLDDDDAKSEIKPGVHRVDMGMYLDDLIGTGSHMIICLAKIDHFLSFMQTEAGTPALGVRRHRWLCRESC